MKRIERVLLYSVTSLFFIQFLIAAAPFGSYINFLSSWTYFKILDVSGNPVESWKQSDKSSHKYGRLDVDGALIANKTSGLAFEASSTIYAPSLLINKASSNSKAHFADSSSGISILADYGQIPVVVQNTDSTNNNYVNLAFMDAESNYAGTIGFQTTNHSTHTSDVVISTNGGAGPVEKLRVNSSGNLTMGPAHAGNITGNVITATSFVDLTPGVSLIGDALLDKVMGWKLEGSIDHYSLGSSAKVVQATRTEIVFRKKTTKEHIKTRTGKVKNNDGEEIILEKEDKIEVLQANKISENPDEVEIIQRITPIEVPVRIINQFVTDLAGALQVEVKKRMDIESRVSVLEASP